MMSYLWILLLGSLLASRAKAQVEDGPADLEPVSFDDPEDVTEVFNTATEEPQPADELDPAADDPVAEEAEAETTTASDSEVVIPAEDEEPEAAEEGSEETTTDAADPADDLVEAGEETTTIAADLPGDISEEITTSEPEPLETTTFTEEEDLPIEASGETATPTPADEQIITTTTTAPPEQEMSTTTAPLPFPVVPVEEAEQTTTAVEEIPLVTEAPADPKEVTPAADVPEADETTTGPLIDEFADQVEGEVVKVNKGSRIFANAPIKEAESHDTPKADETSSKPLAAVLSGIVVSAVGAVAAYFTYQKKKLCFKNRQQADPETGNKGEKADPAEAKSNPETLTPLVDQKS